MTLPVHYNKLPSVNELLNAPIPAIISESTKKLKTPKFLSQFRSRVELETRNPSFNLEGIFRLKRVNEQEQDSYILDGTISMKDIMNYYSNKNMEVPDEIDGVILDKICVDKYGAESMVVIATLKDRDIVTCISKKNN